MSIQKPSRVRAERTAAIAAVARARGLVLPPRPTVPAFLRWQQQYQRDPLAFVRDCIEFPEGMAPTSYQEEALGELPTRGRVAIRSPHGAGKTALASWVILWAALTHDDCKVPVTASAWRQLTKFLWPEVHKWAPRVRWEQTGGVPRPPFSRDELLALSLKRGPTCEAFAVACANHALIEGAHAPRIVYVYDEAKAIPNATFDATEGAFAGAGQDTADEAFALAISTPGAPVGRFYDIHARRPGYEEWWARHWTLEECIQAGRVSAEWADNRRRQWGENSPLYQNRVLGQFASSAEENVIPLAWVEAANERWREWDAAGRPGPLTAIGIDVARFGVNRTVFAGAVDGLRILPLKKYSGADTMKTTGEAKKLLDANPGAVAVIEPIGVGAGPVDRLREQGYGDRVLVYNPGGKTEHTDMSGVVRFQNVRAAGWWLFREMLDPELGEPVALPVDDDLTQQLTCVEWRLTSASVIKVESKADIAKKLDGGSTDEADAVIMALLGPRLAQEFTGSVGVVELPW